VESNCLNDTLCGTEGALAVCLTDTVDQHLRCALDSTGHGSDVVALRMPRKFTDYILQSKRHHLLVISSRRGEGPCAFLLLGCCRFNSISRSRVGEHVLSVLVNFFSVEGRCDNVNCLFVCNSEEASVLVGAPGEAINDFVSDLELASYAGRSYVENYHV
jgi:hypothetical protein